MTDLLNLDSVYDECGPITRSKEAFDYWATSIIQSNVSPKDTCVNGITIKYSEVHLSRPTYFTKVDGKSKKVKLYPEQARRHGLSYSGELTVTVTIDIAGHDEIIVMNNVHIGFIPVMIQSSFCHLHGLNDHMKVKLGEDPQDKGGYFIVNGQEFSISYREHLTLDRIMTMQDEDRDTGRVTITTGYGTSLFRLADDPSGVIEVIFTNLNKNDKKSRNAEINVINVCRLLKPGLKLSEIRSLVTSFIPDEIVAPCIDQFQPTLARSYGLDGIATDEEVVAQHFSWIGSNDPNAVSSVISKAMQEDMFPQIISERPNNGETLKEYQARLIDLQLHTLCLFVAQFLVFRAGYHKYSDRNSWSNKRAESPARTMEKLFRTTWRETQTALFKQLSEKSSVDTVGKIDVLGGVVRKVTNIKGLKNKIRTVLCSGPITNIFTSSFTSGKWGTPRRQDAGVAKRMSRVNLYEFEDSLTQVNVSTSATATGMLPRKVDPAARGFICAVKTPDTDLIGLTKNLALTSSPSMPIDPVGIHNFLLMLRRGTVEIEDDFPGLFTQEEAATMTPKPSTILMFNARMYGRCNGEKMRKYLISCKRRGLIHREAGIVLHDKFWLYVDVAPSRLVRPLLIVNEDTQRLVVDELLESGEIEHRTHSVRELMELGAVEMVSAWEQEYLKIASKPSDIDESRRENEELAQRISLLQQRSNESEDPDITVELNLELESMKSYYEHRMRNYMPYTHVDITQLSMFSVNAAGVVYADHNQPPRNTYQSKMATQALSNPHINHRNRFPTGDTQIVLLKPQPCLVYTRADKLVGIDRGSNSNITIIWCNDPYTQEDAYVFCRDTLESGMGRYSIISTLTKIVPSGHEYSIEFPRIAEGDDPNRYAALDKRTGFPTIGKYVDVGDCVLGVIGRVVKDGREKILNLSHYVKTGEQGIIDDIRVTPRDASYVVDIRIIKTAQPKRGDKFCTRHAQKGTCGDVRDRVLMPYTANGVTADIKINTHAAPTRMTVATFLEAVASKACTIAGRRVDGSPFNEYDIALFYEILSSRGYETDGILSGKEVVYNGLTGEKIDAPCFIAEVNMQFLHHLVDKKIQSRGAGRTNADTGQAPRGKGKGGGIRFGEMERDSGIAHGAAHLLRDRLMMSTDAYEMVFCSCGEIATNDARGGYLPCQHCTDGTFVRSIIPYATKTLINISAGMGTKWKPIFNINNNTPSQDTEEPDDSLADIEDDILQEFTGEDLGGDLTLEDADMW